VRVCMSVCASVCVCVCACMCVCERESKPTCICISSTSVANFCLTFSKVMHLKKVKTNAIMHLTAQANLSGPWENT
jgi:hypothetical protein